mmetsp:Transcript_32020/g.79107  ORF Transcript_32020/g.79107 Transcript_32020/m.79107 type:complete len:82 (-) Transcript_32020:118-363(-)
MRWPHVHRLASRLTSPLRVATGIATARDNEGRRRDAPILQTESRTCGLSLRSWTRLAAGFLQTVPQHNLSHELSCPMRCAL